METAERQLHLFAELPEPLRDAMLRARMAERVGAMLQPPRTGFVVVGAGHVVGPRGLLALLQKQGCSVRQLSKAP